MATVSLRKNVEFYRKQLGSIVNTEAEKFQLLKDLPFYNWSNHHTTVNDSLVGPEPRSEIKLSETVSNSPISSESRSKIGLSSTVSNSSVVSEPRSETELSTTKSSFNHADQLKISAWHAIDFNHAIGLPQKNGVDYPLFDYDELLYNTLQKHKHVWIKKATGLGITEFMLRYMAWLCLKDDSLKGSQMCIITGPREDLAIGLIDRMKQLFTKAIFNENHAQK